MKFDIARAWKDEAYRQSLSEEQLNMLPANPVGELSDADLATICGTGGGGGFPGMGGGAPGVGLGGAPVAPVTPVSPTVNSFSSGSLFANIHRESVAVLLCEVNIFSASIIPILSIAPQTCIKAQ